MGWRDLGSARSDDGHGNTQGRHRRLSREVWRKSGASSSWRDSQTLVRLSGGRKPKHNRDKFIVGVQAKAQRERTRRVIPDEMKDPSPASISRRSDTNLNS